MNLLQGKWPRSVNALAVSLLLLTFAAQLIHVAWIDSANWDEAHHLYDGYRIWTSHDYRLNAEVPPLIKLAAALPLLPLHPYMPGQVSASQAQNAFRAGRAFVFKNGGDRLLFPARMVCMLFTLLLAWLVYAVGRAIFGAMAGLAALAFFVFDPNVLAHGVLVSTDIGSALFLFAAVFAFYRCACGLSSTPARVTLLRLALASLAASLALVAKFTGILVVPMLLLLAFAEAVRLRSFRLLGRLLAACSVIFAGAWLIVWAFYGFRYAAAPAGLELSPALTPYLASLPNPSDAASLAFLARYHLLPQAYIWGLANTRHTEWEYTSYFFGRVYRHGPWQYFPAAFLIKSTLPLLLLLLLAPVVWLRAGWQRARECIFLLVPPAVYFAVITSSHFDIGARHMMPIYPFLYVVAGAATAALVLRAGRAGIAAACVLLVWQVASSLRAGPGYMAYGNEAWGGPSQVRRYLSDANVDWGQQLKGVKHYLNQNHITNCWFAYFPDGAVEPQDYGIDCHRLPTPSGLWWLKLPMEVPPVIEGTVLISESDLEGVESGDGSLNPYNSFRSLTPAAIIEDGVYVYQGRFAVPLASAWVDVRRSGELAQAGEMAESLAAAEQAVQLAPGSARVQLDLADRLAAAGNGSDALTHYRLAQAALFGNRPDLEAEELGPAILKGLQQAPARP